MAKRHLPFVWESLSMEIRLDIILSEQCRSENWAIINEWSGNRPQLIKAIACRGIVWNKNKDIDTENQLAYIETARMDIVCNWLQIKQAFVSLYLIGVAPIKDTMEHAKHVPCPTEFPTTHQRNVAHAVGVEPRPHVQRAINK